jgi:hypothetical protein
MDNLSAKLSNAQGTVSFDATTVVESYFDLDEFKNQVRSSGIPQDILDALHSEPFSLFGFSDEDFATAIEYITDDPGNLNSTLTSTSRLLRGEIEAPPNLVTSPGSSWHMFIGGLLAMSLLARRVRPWL